MESRDAVLIRWRGVAESSPSSGKCGKADIDARSRGVVLLVAFALWRCLPTGTSVNEADADDRAESAWQRAQSPVEIRELVLEDQRGHNAIWVSLPPPKRARS